MCHFALSSSGGCQEVCFLSLTNTEHVHLCWNVIIMMWVATSQVAKTCTLHFAKGGHLPVQRRAPPVKQHQQKSTTAPNASLERFPSMNEANEKKSPRVKTYQCTIGESTVNTFHFTCREQAQFPMLRKTCMMLVGSNNLPHQRWTHHVTGKDTLLEWVPWFEIR